jgi:hypothetical protein
MQKPFTLTNEMAQELANEVATLAPQGDEAAHDPVGASPFAPRLRRRKDDLLHSESDAARPQDDQQAIAEDPINPSHYRKHPSGVECIEITEHMTFNSGNAVKYIWRYMDKGDPVENLRKAQWYLEREILRLTRAPR